MLLIITLFCSVIVEAKYRNLGEYTAGLRFERMKMVLSAGVYVALQGESIVIGDGFPWRCAARFALGYFISRRCRDKNEPSITVCLLPHSRNADVFVQIGPMNSVSNPSAIFSFGYCFKKLRIASASLIESAVTDDSPDTSLS